MFILSVTVDIL